MKDPALARRMHSFQSFSVHQATDHGRDLDLRLPSIRHFGCSDNPSGELRLNLGLEAIQGLEWLDVKTCGPGLHLELGSELGGVHEPFETV